VRKVPLPLPIQAEFQLLVQCLHSEPDKSAILVTCQHVSSWQIFLDICRAHAVRPLVRKTLASTGWAQIPNEVRCALEEFTARNRRRNTLLSLETVRIITLLKSRGVQAATFKGPLLSEHLYGDLTLREFVDVDILVNSPDAALAEGLLSQSGYDKGNSGEDPEYLAQSGQVAFLRRDAPYGIDLHWKLAPFGMPLPFSDAEIQAGLQELTVAGTPVPTLSWNHLALFLAFHGAKERWRLLKWICDFSRLYVARPELDWELLRQQAASTHCSRNLLVAARLCEALGFDAPPSLLSAARRNPSVDRLVQRILRKLVHPQPETELSEFIDTLLTAERVRDKVRLTFALLTTLTVSDFRAIRLPRQLRGLYYMVRPVRLAAKVTGLTILGQRPRAKR